MRYLHTMLRVRHLDRALDFYCNVLGLDEARRRAEAVAKVILPCNSTTWSAAKPDI
jgi:lactoylglutathione lyase